jgi:mitochondrial fission protein ELM1
MSAPRTSPPLAVLLISDGKPGHYALSEAIVAAIARRRAVAVTRVDVARPSWLPPRALSVLTNLRAGFTPKLVGFDLATPDRRDPQRPGIIVSAGGDTLAANVFAARYHNSPNVFYGSLRRYRPEDFALVLTSYLEHAGQPNTVMTLKPSAQDPSEIPLPPRIASGPVSIGVLVGGDSGTVRYAPADWDALLALCQHSNPETVCFVVANSRRTPDAVSDCLVTLAAAGRIGFVDVRTAGPGTLGPLLAGSHAILATVDSSSMISEAIWARRPVAVLTPERWSLPALESGYRDYLARNGWTVEMPLSGATPAGVLTALDRVTPIGGNPLDDLAALLDRRLPQLEL